jgi:hypothetical protein
MTHTLIATGPVMADGKARNVMFHANMANYVCAWDADDGTPLWQQCVGQPVTGTKAIDTWFINEHWGVLSTPVVDLDTQTIYCVAWSSPDGSVDNASFSLHALRLIDGCPRTTPLSLEDATYDPGNGLPVQQFRGAARKQRSGLLLTVVNGLKTIFIAFGSILETEPSARGWVIAVDLTAATPTVAAAWSSTARYSGAGIWMAGQGPAALPDGRLYLMTGNGAFDGITDFGECLLELTYTPATGAQPASLKCTDWFSPFSDAGRAGDDPTLPQPSSADGRGGASSTDEYTDMDLGSGGLCLIPELGFALGAGKDGIAYVLKIGSFGKTMPGDFASDKIAGNYARCASPPTWFTYLNPDVTPTPTDLTKLNIHYNNLTHHQHSTPIVFKSSVHGWMVFTWGENDYLHAWSLDGTGKLTHLARGNERASPGAPVAPGKAYGGMPGGMITLSANGAEPGTAIIWACVPYADANKSLTGGRLLAYDAENFGTFGDGSRQLRVLWDSQSRDAQFVHNKFNIPVVANGKLYVPNYSGGIDVYSPDDTGAPDSADSGTQNSRGRVMRTAAERETGV